MAIPGFWSNLGQVPMVALIRNGCRYYLEYLSDSLRVDKKTKLGIRKGKNILLNRMYVLNNEIEKNWLSLSVVYFDQRTGALHAVRWSK